MKRILLFSIMMLVGVSVSAQKRYDEIKYPPLNDFQKAKVEEFQLDNGITFYLVEDKELPLIRLNAIVRTGSLLDPEGKEGLASMVGTVMREGGSENYPADELNLLLENKAASISTFIGEGSGNASMNLLKEDFDELLPVFVDVIQNPLFPEDKIELAKTQTKSAISRRNDQQAGIASREFAKLIYGEDSPYTRQTEYASVDAITREDMEAFHKDAFVGNNMIIGVIGDFDTRDMKRKLEEAFGSLPAGSETNLVYPEVNYSYPSTVNLVDKPDVNQSYVILGHIGGLRENPDYAALQMMNEILSGGFAGRLFKTVRTDLGLAYAVGGSYGSRINYPGTFSLTVMTKSSTTAQAIDAILNEVKKMQNEPVTNKELNDARDRFLNSLIFRYDSKSKILNERLSNEYNGLPEDTFDKYVENIRKVTVSDVQRVARQYLKPDRVQILVVGNKEEIGDQLNKYGPVNELDITIPEPKAEGEQTVGDTAQGKIWLKRMAEAIIQPGKKVKTIKTVSHVTQATPMGEMQIKSTATINFENISMEASLETPQGTMGMSLSDGQGTMSMMGQEQQLPPAMVGPMLKEIRNSYIYLALNYQNVEAEYMGTENIDGTDYVVLKLTLDGSSIYLVDPDTNLPYKVRTSQFNPQAGKVIDSETTFTDWQVIDGVAYAFADITTSNGEKASETKVESVEVD